MKESDWWDCLSANSSTEVSTDPFKIKSLIDTAQGRVEFIEKIKPTPENANYIFESYYSSLIELMHALVLKRNYKVSNHICLGYFLRDVLKNDALFRIFDDCRYKRNSLVYYGKRMEAVIAEESITQIKKLIKEIKIICNQ